MARLGRSIEEYKQNGGWSSAYFANSAITLMTEFNMKGVDVIVGRTVVHLKTSKTKLKVYVHRNGRSEEYATITDWKGNELFTAHHTEFEKLADYLRENLL